MFAGIKEDIKSVFERDPAARSSFEVLTNYPGLHAIWWHRLSHRLWCANWKWLARFLSTIARWLTGVEIHPAAQLGRGLFIDHGMGVIIGETAILMENVTIYQQVTLGGTGKEEEDRHPKIGDGVLIGAGAKVLGNIRVGNCSRVAAGSVVLTEVPPCKTVAGVPAKIVGEAGCDQPSVVMDQLFQGCGG